MAVSLICAASVSADRTAEASIMDDQLLLGASMQKVDKQMAIFRKLGVDRLRVSAFWNQLAPDALSETAPQGFTGADQADKRYGWGPLDRVVVSARQHGLRVMISITTPAPLWATGSPRKRNPLWKPKAGLFGNFASAVATRYAAYADHYGISNEPNQGGWLQPQSDRSGLISPHLYRGLVLAAYPRIKVADPTSVALIGNLSSSGRDQRGRRNAIRPLAFLRAFACVNRRYQPTRRGRCRKFKRIPTDAFAHHPYEFFQPPNQRSRDRDDAGIGDTGRLLKVLDRLRAKRRIRPSNGRPLKVFYTEFGYQTNPPDPLAGIPLGRQSRYVQYAAYVAWRTRRVKGLNQFRLTDGRFRGRGITRYKEFQSGLLFSNRRKKPAFRGYANPFVAPAGTHPRSGGSIFLWGQARPGGRHTVSLQFRTSKRARFRTIARVRTDRRGYFTRRTRARHGYYRFKHNDSALGSSGAILVQPR